MQDFLLKKILLLMKTASGAYKVVEGNKEIINIIRSYINFYQNQDYHVMLNIGFVKGTNSSV
jgi:hypothetical protein